MMTPAGSAGQAQIEHVESQALGRARQSNRHDGSLSTRSTRLSASGERLDVLLLTVRTAG